MIISSVHLFVLRAGPGQITLMSSVSLVALPFCHACQCSSTGSKSDGTLRQSVWLMTDFLQTLAFPFWSLRVRYCGTCIAFISSLLVVIPFLMMRRAAETISSCLWLCQSVAGRYQYEFQNKPPGCHYCNRMIADDQVIISAACRGVPVPAMRRTASAPANATDGRMVCWEKLMLQDSVLSCSARASLLFSVPIRTGFASHKQQLQRSSLLRR